MKPVVIAAVLLWATAAAAQQPASASAPRKLALVIGIQNYSKLPPLKAVPDEVDRVMKALKGAGFDLTVPDKPDVTLDVLDKTLDTFYSKVKADDICFFYFSGYAAAGQDGEDDYLIPAEFDPASGTLHSNADQVRTIATSLQEKTKALKMFFIEGARRFGADITISDAKRGLILPDTQGLTEVLFGIPTAVGQLTDTPPDHPGLFTVALAEMINKDGVPITRFMTEVLKTVIDKSNAQQQPAQSPKLTKEFFFHPPKPAPHQDRIDREEYVFISGGTFLMGCVPADKKCDNNEKPQHKVTLTKGFWMGQNEVQVVSYKKFVADDKKNRKMPPAVDWNKKWEKDNDPISYMKWEDAQSYCHWAGGRLPTEAEWEYAARAGKTDEIYPCPVENSRNCANFSGQEGGTDIWEFTAPVRKFDPNAWGLFDMAGNVWEWVYDFFGPYSNDPATDPQGPPTGKQHVKRGGSFFSSAEKHLRISVRAPSNPDTNIGFRCVLDDTPETRRILQIP